MELIAAIQQEATARRILLHRGLPTRAPPRGRPWSSQRALALERRSDQNVDPPSALD